MCCIQFIISVFTDWWERQNSEYLGHEDKEYQENIQGW